MFGKPKSKTIHGPTASMKKKAPPRPPPPSSKSTNIPRSASTGFDSYNVQKSKPQQVQRTQTMGCSYNIANRSDLIDLSSPSNSPPKVSSPFAENYPGATSNEVPDFKYHIGASIFYVKSELKPSAGGAKPTANPFSPPRPTPQSLLSKIKPVTLSTATTKQPTIIKANTQTNESLNNNNYGSTSQGKAPAVLLDWDEPPKKSYVPPPTVIRPIPPPKKPGLASIRLPDRNSLSSGPPSFVPPPVSNSPALRYEEALPRYEEPPEESDDDFDESFDLNAVPEPAEPPPPPPQDLDDYSSGDRNDQYRYSNQNYVPDAADSAYGIALYDYVSGEVGDLQFAAGDVIYLIRCVDESWLFGSSGSYEGMFPANFINIVVPLEGVGTYHTESSNDIQSALSSNDIYTESISRPTYYVQVLHGFEAQEPTDLGIRDGDIVTVIGQVNEDWLYGELDGRRGQFPASFLEYVPGNLPIIDPKAQ